MFFHLNEEETTKLSDEELLASSLKNPRLFSFLLDRHQKSFLRRAAEIMKDRDLAEDVVQETFVKIYKSGRSFVPMGGGSFKSWAYKVLKNTALSHYRKFKNGGTVVLSDELAEILKDDKEEAERAGYENRDYISSILRRMPERFSGILSDFLLNGKSQEEIARESKISLSAVKVRIYRAKEMFRDIATSIR